MAEDTRLEALGWAVARLTRLQEICEKNAGMYGAKLLKGHGYPDQVMSDAMDALALRTALAALPPAALKQQCPYCHEWCAHGFCGKCECVLPAEPAP